mmetsp:Transcript_14077/g.30106  ORF Transcript_14077/g.30106 Transcript_14077/m.30106 type:complete len:341 (-) Transcript_14077:264-1286(-)
MPWDPPLLAAPGLRSPRAHMAAVSPDDLGAGWRLPGLWLLDRDGSREPPAAREAPAAGQRPPRGQPGARTSVGSPPGWIRARSRRLRREHAHDGGDHPGAAADEPWWSSPPGGAWRHPHGRVRRREPLEAWDVLRQRAACGGAAVGPGGGGAGVDAEIGQGRERPGSPAAGPPRAAEGRWRRARQPLRAVWGGRLQEERPGAGADGGGAPPQEAARAGLGLLRALRRGGPHRPKDWQDRRLRTPRVRHLQREEGEGKDQRGDEQRALPLRVDDERPHRLDLRERGRRGVPVRNGERRAAPAPQRRPTQPLRAVDGAQGPPAQGQGGDARRGAPRRGRGAV